MKKKKKKSRTDRTRKEVEKKEEEEETLEGITWTCFLGQFAAGQGNKEKLSLWGNVF